MSLKEIQEVMKWASHLELLTTLTDEGNVCMSLPSNKLFSLLEKGVDSPPYVTLKNSNNPENNVREIKRILVGTSSQRTNETFTVGPSLT